MTPHEIVVSALGVVVGFLGCLSAWLKSSIHVAEKRKINDESIRLMDAKTQDQFKSMESLAIKGNLDAINDMRETINGMKQKDQEQQKQINVLIAERETARAQLDSNAREIAELKKTNSILEQTARKLRTICLAMLKAQGYSDQKIAEEIGESI